MLCLIRETKEKLAFLRVISGKRVGAPGSWQKFRCKVIFRKEQKGTLEFWLKVWRSLEEFGEKYSSGILKFYRKPRAFSGILQNKNTCLRRLDLEKSLFFFEKNREVILFTFTN